MNIMNQSERVEREQKYRVGKQIIAVCELVRDGQALKRQELWRGLLVGLTTRGLLLVPLGDYGNSSDALAASFCAFPEHRKDGNYEYKIHKELE